MAYWSRLLLTTEQPLLMATNSPDMTATESALLQLALGVTTASRLLFRTNQSIQEYLSGMMGAHIGHKMLRIKILVRVLAL